ncbi:cation transporter [Geobacter sulfurreducens]|jgi:cobalt-zinc-cadmium efflux system protein|uniref:Cobalt/zinc/iron/cadmium/nickel efflux protein n=1 Tax=Geobacter sulfurreducens (strain ATCC 51573 / DSM 12127 / PCA) TaxID=243231 RepID=Q74FW5_GEOSL|nr:cation diffusion facilitator family transporter [Geobacter sulfurreducens]AAR33819.1 cobalt/zinc/iron/cadmium/nickel efflux protein [Geobacter sulfurreducens PCA]ADI83337.1 cobalt/zinc/iron/cadmium/nickel efflux protein [Geobacter sulfurreducens KN400]AJY70205.1 cation transporter [Geobacter sulfurreducens]QVW35743.1 cation transporter [Geobacter sulfurreducens]UAC04565.1 cation diffusion facilitator family transporter [Geobacter sulfurreducens]
MHADSHLDRSITGRLKYAIALTALTLVAEIVGGIWTNSLALLSDAAHVFLDLFALVLSLAAIKLASYPASDTKTFGWHRAEVFASFINGATVFLMALGIFYEAVGRLMNPEAVKSLPMLLIATLGLVMNLISATALHGHSHDDLNVRSAFLHVVGDAAASVGVIVGGLIMYFTGWYVLDALISIGIGCVIFAGSWRVLREAAHILLEGVPRGMSTQQVANEMAGVEGVNAVHQMNIWTICSHILALSAHVDVKPEYKGQQAEVLRQIEQLLFERYHITHTTLQAECTRCVDGPVIKDLRHRPRHGQSHDDHHHAHAHCTHGPHGHHHGHSH